MAVLPVPSQPTVPSPRGGGVTESAASGSGAGFEALIAKLGGGAQTSQKTETAEPARPASPPRPSASRTTATEQRPPAKPAAPEETSDSAAADNQTATADMATTNEGVASVTSTDTASGDGDTAQAVTTDQPTDSASAEVAIVPPPAPPPPVDAVAAAPIIAATLPEAAPAPTADVTDQARPVVPADPEAVLPQPPVTAEPVIEPTPAITPELDVADTAVTPQPQPQPVLPVEAEGAATPAAAALAAALAEAAPTDDDVTVPVAAPVSPDTAPAEAPSSPVAAAPAAAPVTQPQPTLAQPAPTPAPAATSNATAAQATATAEAAPAATPPVVTPPAAPPVQAAENAQSVAEAAAQAVETAGTAAASVTIVADTTRPAAKPPRPQDGKTPDPRTVLSAADRARGLSERMDAPTLLTGRDLAATITQLVNQADDFTQPAVTEFQDEIASASRAPVGEMTSVAAASHQQNNIHQTPASAAMAPRAPAQPHPAVQQVAVHLQKAAEDGGGRVSIMMRPAALGRVAVDLDVGHDGKVTAVVTADRPETLDLLRRDSSSLERALQDAGLKTDNGSLSFNLRGDSRGTPDREFGGRQRGGADTGPVVPPEEIDDLADAGPVGALSSVNMRV